MSALTKTDLEAIARRSAELTVELLANREPAVARYIDVATAAKRLSMSKDWIRRHAAVLGASRLGDGRRGELRFDVRVLERFVAERRLEQDSPRQRRKPGPRPGVGFEILTSRRRKSHASGQEWKGPTC
jgi:hypothetical protein